MFLKVCVTGHVATCKVLLMTDFHRLARVMLIYIHSNDATSVARNLWLKHCKGKIKDFNMPLITLRILFCFLSRDLSWG